jgi:hypothetical protein
MAANLSMMARNIKRYLIARPFMLAIHRKKPSALTIWLFAKIAVIQSQYIFWASTRMRCNMKPITESVIMLVVMCAFTAGWLKFYDGQPTWWHLILWLAE